MRSFKHGRTYKVPIQGFEPSIAIYQRFVKSESGCNGTCCICGQPVTNYHSFTDKGQGFECMVGSTCASKVEEVVEFKESSDYGQDVLGLVAQTNLLMQTNTKGDMRLVMDCIMANVRNIRKSIQEDGDSYFESTDQEAD